MISRVIESRREGRKMALGTETEGGYCCFVCAMGYGHAPCACYMLYGPIMGTIHPRASKLSPYWLPGLISWVIPSCLHLHYLAVSCTVGAFGILLRISKIAFLSSLSVSMSARIFLFSSEISMTFCHNSDNFCSSK